MEKISYFREILDKEELVLSIIKEELIEIKINMAMKEKQK